MRSWFGRYCVPVAIGVECIGSSVPRIVALSLLIGAIFYEHLFQERIAVIKETRDAARVDLAVCALGLTVFVTSALNRCLLTSATEALSNVAAGFLIYCCGRGIREAEEDTTCGIMASLAIMLSVAGLLRFALRSAAWSALAFPADMTAFKPWLSIFSENAPPGSASLILVALLTVTAGFGLAHRQRLRNAAGLASVLLVVCILLTFSRAAYLASAIFLTGAVLIARKVIYPLDRTRLWNISVGISCIALLVVSMNASQSVLRTICLFGTQSQVRSARSRVRSALLDVRVFTLHPIVGVGIGRESLLRSTVAGDPREARSFCALLQFLGEAGLAGLLAATWVVGSVVIASWRLRRHLTVSDPYVARGLLGIVGLGAIAAHQCLFSGILYQRASCVVVAIELAQVTNMLDGLARKSNDVI